MTAEERDAMNERARESDARREASQRSARLIVVADKLGKRYAPDRATLASYVVTHERQKAVLARVKAFAAELSPKASTVRGLVLYGTVGTGKDHLLAALLYDAARIGLNADWCNGQNIFGRFRDAMDTGESEAGLVSTFTKPDVLGISDPIPPIVDANRPQAWRTELLYRVLDARYRECRPTWVTVNATSADDAAAKLSSPVFDRLRDGAELIPCFWPSHREKAK